MYREEKSVQKLFRTGVGELYNDNGGFIAGSSFQGSYKMSDLNGPDGDRMKREVLEDLLNGKSITDSRLFSAEFFLGSFGFSMRVSNDGKYMAITVYDSKTVQSATDGGKKILRNLSPFDENTAPTYQRYFWVMPITEVVNAYKESMISAYKSR